MPCLPILSRSGSVPTRALRAGLSVLAALVLGTCTDTPSAPGRTGRLLIRPAFDGSALFAPLPIDNLRLIVVRPPSEVLKTIIQPFPANANQVTVTAADIQLESSTEDLLVTIELYAGTTLLFTGTQTVTVTEGVTPQPASIPMGYQGPGANLAALTLTPRDTTVRPGAVYTYQVTAVDALQQPVPSFYVGWQASAGTITGTGQFAAPATRDTITITVSAPAPNTTKDSTRVFVIAAPGSLTITGGDAQTAQVATRLPQLLQVRVNGTDNLPLPGVVVNFTATTGGGSVDSATATSDAQGIARTGATLGGTVGPQTFTASAAGLASVVFTQTATAVVGGIAWNGSVSNAWNTPTNWTPAVVPGLADNVTIPAGPSTQPVVSITANMNDLTIASGATVTLAGSFTFNVAGNLAANGALVVSSGTPTIQLSGTAKTLVGNLASATVTGTVTLAGATTVTGNVAVSGGAARLDIGANTLLIGGGFSTGSGGRLGMASAGGQLTVAGSAAFGGGDETGLLTAGTLSVAGNFTQSGSGSPTSFVGSGTHTVLLSGTGAQTINFGSPGFAQSRFQNVIIDNSGGGVTATSNIYATGTPGVTPTAVRTLSGNGSTLFTTILDVSNFTFNNLLLNFSGTALVGFDSVTFQGYAPTATPLTISHPGAGSPFTFLNLSFTVTPTTGFYISATDANAADGVPLVIDMSNPTPADPAGRVQTAGGAVVNWAPPAGVRTWTGATSTNWSVATNWNPQGVPTSADDVVIPAGPSNMPAVTTSCSAKTLTVNTGATLNLGGFNCTVAGNVFADGAITGTGAVAIATPAQIRGNFPSLILSAKITQAAAVTATGNVTVTGIAGSYVIGGQSLTMGGNLGVQSGARLVMLNPADLVTVAGNAVFSGGFELDSLNAGTLSIGGNLTQNTGSTGDTYHTSGTHQTVFTGNNPTIFFNTPGDVPGTSHFQQFAWTGTGTLSLTSDAYAHVSFTTTSTSPVSISGAGHLLSVGNYVAAGPVTFSNTRLALNAPSGGPLTLNNATFQGLATTAIQLTVNHPGSGGPFTFDNLTFSVTPTGAGRYLSATDADGPTPTPLTINVTNSTPASPGAFVTLANGAVVNWPPATPIRIWGGTSSTDWFTPANWVGGVAPATTDNVTIPAGTSFAPTISSTTAVNDLTVQPGAVLSLGDIGLNVTGNLDASGSIAGCCGDFIGMSGGTLRGNFSQVVLSVSPGGVVTLNGATTLTLTSSSVQVEGELILNGNTLDAGPTFSTLNGTGLVTMTNPLDQVIAGTTNFTGGDETGRLTAGVLRTQSLNQGGTVPTSFLTGGNHTVILGGPSGSTVTLTNPGSSRFQDLDVSGVSGTLTLGSNVTVAGQLISLPISSNGPTITGTGVTLTAGGADVSAFTGFTALTMDGVPLVLSGGTISGFSRVSFQNQNPTGTHLTVNNVGQATPYLFSGLTFAGQLSAGGFYLVANDLDGPSPDPLTINVLASTPSSGAGVSKVSNGAVINWPASGNVFTWDGSANNDWFNPANWDRNAVPGAIDDVILALGTNQPVLTNSAVVNSLSSGTGSILDLKGFVLVANGDVDVAGSIVDGVGGGGVTLVGPSRTVRGTINAELAVIGDYALNGNLITNANLSVQGVLDISSFTAQVGASFLTLNNGVLVMSTSGGLLDVGLDAIFAGGSTDGLLTAGTLRIGGAFDQIGSNSPQSFAANPGHLTVIGLGGFGDTVDITFTTPGPTQSHFGDLSEDLFGATFRLNSDVVALGNLSGGDGFGGSLLGASCPVVFTITRFSTSGPLELDCVQLVVDDPGGTNIFGINGITFTNLPTDVIQLTIRHPGLAAGSLTTGFLTFVPLTSGNTGSYIRVEDTDAASPLLNVLLPVSGTNVTNGPSFTIEVGGGTVTWP
jgi:hypothetical protein